MGVFTTAARTWAAAEILSATNLNAQLRDLINGFGAGTAYTPTWTSSGTAPALGNGTLTGKYTQIGKLVRFELHLTTGSTSTYGTGSYSFTVPVIAAGVTSLPMGSAVIVDNGVGRYLGVSWLNTSTTISVLTQPAAGVSPLVGQTSPQTWATGDEMYISGTYEAA